MLETVVAFIKAVPVIKKWVEQLIALYVAQQIKAMREADREAIRKAVYDFDQRDLEKQIGSTKPGEPSGLPGTHIRDSLPNVPSGLQADP